MSTDANAERVEKLGVGRITGALLVAVWAGVLVAVIVLRRHTDYAHHEALYWWEAFYRTGSIIFGGGQVRTTPIHLPCSWQSVVARLGMCPRAELMQSQQVCGAQPVVSSSPKTLSLATMCEGSSKRKTLAGYLIVHAQVQQLHKTLWV